MYDGINKHGRISSLACPSLHVPCPTRRPDLPEKTIQTTLGQHQRPTTTKYMLGWVWLGWVGLSWVGVSCCFHQRKQLTAVTTVHQRKFLARATAICYFFMLFQLLFATGLCLLIASVLCSSCRWVHSKPKETATTITPYATVAAAAINRFRR